ncbi:hypothetical protein [Paenibacillus melissococcoides]|uniref:hypothetical protein n=1 Tax=Paenibacillus melissococcoides TaxID=2912268 RepID=UPI0021C4B164|nr:hypothetical protein [Paenibacillus melissococcoides]CAH8721007.1 hypothetical protein HTL2_006142 [Paenibacillus melissococcoides]CAH8721026.1 hypothetical protein HTL2_006147 [Paenibacillus melissococcoides]
MTFRMKTWRSTAENKRHNWEEESLWHCHKDAIQRSSPTEETLVIPVKGGVKIFDGSFVAIDANGLARSGGKSNQFDRSRAS